MSADSSSAPPPALRDTLLTLAVEYSQNAPPELYRIFPEWNSELQSILLSQNEGQLRAAISGLEHEAEKADGSAANSYHFAKRALLAALNVHDACCLLYTSPSPRDRQKSRMPSSA